MAGYHSFFSRINNTWDEYYYSNLRDKYSTAVPLPSKKYFRPIDSIDDLTTLTVRPIEKPLWLGLNTLSFLLKAILYSAMSIVLAPCALALLLVAPNSELSGQTSAAFKLAATHSIVATGMAVVALLATAISLIFNPLFLASRVAATVVDSLNSTTEACCGLTIARL